VKLSKTASELHDLQYFGKIYPGYLILHEIPAKYPRFGRHIGFVGGAKARLFSHFVGNS
jgi:hypothetical protein